MAPTQSDYTILLTISLFSWVTFFATYIPGLFSEWYAKLEQIELNVWFPRVGWIIAGVLSYVGLWILSKRIKKGEEYRLATLSILYIIGNFILIAWSGAFFQGENFSMGVMLSSILFIYEFWVFLYVVYIDVVAGIFTLPLLIMYMYLFYTMLQLEELNIK